MSSRPRTRVQKSFQNKAYSWNFIKFRYAYTHKCYSTCNKKSYYIFLFFDVERFAFLNETWLRRKSINRHRDITTCFIMNAQYMFRRSIKQKQIYSDDSKQRFSGVVIPLPRLVGWLYLLCGKNRYSLLTIHPVLNSNKKICTVQFIMWIVLNHCRWSTLNGPKSMLFDSQQCNHPCCISCF